MSLLSEKFDSTLKSNIENISIEIADTGLDKLIDSEILKEVPIIKYLYSGRKFYLSIKDFQFVRKLVEFLNELSTVPQDKREKFFKEISKDEKKLGENILLLVDRLDSDKKPVLIAKILKALIDGKISLEMFYRLCYVVEKTYVNDLYRLKENFQTGEYSGFSGMNLSNSGLVVRYTYDGGTWDGNNEKTDENEIGFRITELGKKLIEVAF